MSFKNHFGLDIGSHNLKLIELSGGPTNFKLQNFGQLPTPPESQFDNARSDLTPLVETVKQLIRNSHASSRQVVVGLPESQIYTRVIQMPKMNESELSSAIKYQLEQYVPLQPDEVMEKHTIINSESQIKEGEMDVLLVASPNFLVDRLVSVVERSGLELMAIDTEILASSRAIVGSNIHSPTTLLINLGSRSTDLAVVKRGDLIATRSISSGTSAMLRAVSTDLSIDPAQAEEYIKKYGLDNNQLSGSVAKALSPVLDLLSSEVKRILATVSSSNAADPVKRVVIFGGGALLPGLVEYLASSLNLEVELGNPFAQVSRSEKQIQEMGDSVAVYTESVGLAMKEV